MSMIDIGKLLAPISAEQPSGPNKEYDPPFQALEQLLQLRPDETGNAIAEPNWREVLDKAVALTAETKDVRVLVMACRALTRLGGLPGLADGLTLLRGLLEGQWATINPPLEDGDPLVRTNALLGLVDRDTHLKNVREAELVKAQGLGRFTLRDYLLASGKEKAVDPATVQPITSIEAAFSAVPVEELQATTAGATRALDEWLALIKFLHATVGVDRTPPLEPLTAALKEAKGVLSAQLALRVPTLTDDAATTAGAAGAGKPATGEVRSREDVVKALERIIDFYHRSEPSSPVPILLQRAKRLVTMNFLDLVKDLAPDGLKQIEQIRGPKDS